MFSLEYACCKNILSKTSGLSDIVFASSNLSVYKENCQRKLVMFEICPCEWHVKENMTSVRNSDYKVSYSDSVFVPLCFLNIPEGVFFFGIGTMCVVSQQQKLFNKALIKPERKSSQHFSLRMLVPRLTANLRWLAVACD